MINTVTIFSDDFKMRFGLQKCATIMTKRGREVKVGIMMPNSGVINDLGDALLVFGWYD